MELPRGIRVRGNSYQVNVTRGGRRLSATAATLDEAKEKHKSLSEQLAPRGAASSGWTMQTAFDRACSKWAGTNGEKTARMNAKAAVAYFGAARPISMIDADALEEYREHLVQLGNSNGTINRKFSALSKMLTLAVDHGKLDKKPKIQRLKETACRIRFLSEHEEAGFIAIIRHWGRDTHADVFVVLIDTGLRGSELWRLQARDVDLNANTLSIWVNKTDRPRTIPMTKRVREILARLIQQTSGVLFPELDNWTFRRTFERAKAHLGLDGDAALVPYCLRHTCCTRLIRRGVPLRVVMEWMGHANIQTTMRYAHLAPTDLAACARILETGETWGF